MSKSESKQELTQKLRRYKQEQSQVRLVLEDGGQLSGTVNWIDEEEVNLSEDVGKNRIVTVELDSIVRCYELKSSQVNEVQYSENTPGDNYR